MTLQWTSSMLDRARKHFQGNGHVKVKGQKNRTMHRFHACRLMCPEHMKQLPFIASKQWPGHNFQGEGHIFKAEGQKVKNT